MRKNPLKTWLIFCCLVLLFCLNVTPCPALSPPCPPAGLTGAGQLTSLSLAIPVCPGSVRDNGQSNSLQQRAGCVTGKQPATPGETQPQLKPNIKIQTGRTGWRDSCSRVAMLINLISPINLYAGCFTKTVIFNLIMNVTDSTLVVV